MAKQTIRVFRDGSVWVAKKDKMRASAVKNTQREAYLAAKEIALRQGLTITVYHPTGGIKAVINPKNREQEQSNCFITTACVKYFDLQDNCYELRTLRNFRDSHLLATSQGRKLVEQYYEIAPVLVKKLDLDGGRDKLYDQVFQRIQAACRAIEKNELENAKDIYTKAVAFLFQYFEIK